MARIRYLLKLGIFAALMVIAGDMLLGWGVHETKSGMEGFLCMYLVPARQHDFLVVSKEMALWIAMM
ncbi:MAG: hypothetical protein IJP78_12885 [Clostridia bacterium]|nr:hypothetical protein [Clostridia bacterium]